jgi:Flp pilus assembly pilin Flp
MAMLHRMSTCLRSLRIVRSGATAIEYALIAALISMTIFIWAVSIGTSTSSMFMSIVSGL